MNSYLNPSGGIINPLDKYLNPSGGSKITLRKVSNCKSDFQTPPVKIKSLRLSPVESKSYYKLLCVKINIYVNMDYLK